MGGEILLQSKQDVGTDVAFSVQMRNKDCDITQTELEKSTLKELQKRLQTDEVHHLNSTGKIGKIIISQQEVERKVNLLKDNDLQSLSNVKFVKQKKKDKIVEAGRRQILAKHLQLKFLKYLSICFYVLFGCVISSFFTIFY